MRSQKKLCSLNHTVTDLRFTSTKTKLQHFLQRLKMQDIILGIHAALYKCIPEMLKLLKIAPANMGVAPRHALKGILMPHLMCSELPPLATARV